MRLIKLVICCLLLSSCSREPKIKDGHLEIVKPESLSSTLYFSGSIQPLHSVVVPSPVEGVVIDMPLQYGDVVEPGKLLFMLSSAKFLTDYKSALMQYIKAKSDFDTSKVQLSEGEFLHKNLLISDDDFKVKQANYYSSRLVLLQAKDTLEVLLQQLDIKNVDLYNISIADIDKIDQAMHIERKSDNLRILSPVSGVLLGPIKNDDDNKKIAKGDNVKQGDVLAIIGDMSGISVKIKVNELTVNQLHIGQKVKVTGIAFPEYALTGSISRVDKQAETTNGNIPAFAVVVTVPKLTKEQQAAIHVGMSAKVEVSLNDDSQMLIPINAIVEKSGGSYVKRYDKTTKQLQEVLVSTGKTTPSAVTIISGIQAGDSIVVPNQA